MEFIVAELHNEVVGFCRYVDSNKFTQDMLDVDCELLALYVRPYSVIPMLFTLTFSTLIFLIYSSIYPMYGIFLYFSSISKPYPTTNLFSILNAV